VGFCSHASNLEWSPGAYQKNAPMAVGLKPPTYIMQSQAVYQLSYPDPHTLEMTRVSEYHLDKILIKNGRLYRRQHG